jgi:hypothetical protein
MARRVADACREALVDSLPPDERHLRLSVSSVRALDAKGYRLRGILADTGTKRYIECRVGESDGNLKVIGLSVAQW